MLETASDATGKAIGPFELGEVIGRGAMAVVYRARHRKTGAEVALKTLQVAEEWMATALRREIGALATVCHPGIVPMLGHGVARGVPWYAMQAVAGVALHRYCAGCVANALQVSGGGGGSWHQAVLAALPEILTAVRSLCAPLAFLHGEGYVHRDLKPDNVIVRPDGIPIIMDLGLAWRAGGTASSRELLERAGIVGTPEYMAPEQIRGEPVDARADLYSLGCILHELLLARRPFAAPDPIDVLRKQLHSDPETLRKVNPELPEELDNLVSSLLRKCPRDRPGHADAVASVLERLGASDRLAGAGPPAKPYLYQPGLSGRGAELAVLERAIKRLCAGSGGMVLLVGQAGIGKTRLLLEVTGLSERLGCEVLVGTAMPAEPGPDRRPLGLFLEPLRIVAERCHAGGIAETERVIAERGGVLAQFQPLIRELCAASGAFAEVTELPPDAARLRLFTYLEQTLAAVAEPRPLVLLLDDLQWADALSAAAVRHLATARRSASRRLLLIAATRPRSLGAGEAEVAPATGAQELTLPHLSEAALHQVIADMLGVRAAPREFVGYVAKQSGGNPYFAAEYLRAAIASSLLLMDHRGGWRWSGGKQPAARLALPASLGQAMALRLGELDASATSVAQIAAVLGGEQAADLLGAVLGGEEDRFARALHALVTADVLEEQRPGALRFCHDELRRLAQEGVSEARRREIQERAAVAMEAAGMSADATVAGTLGLRWEAAGRPERARPYFLAAARHAASRYSPAEAARLFAAYFRTCDGATEESISARLAYATEALGYGQDPDAADSQLRLAMAEAAALGARGCEAEALHRLGKMHLDAGDLAGSSRHQAAALKIWEEIADRSGQARAWLEMAQIALDRGDAEEAMALCTRARDHCRGAGDDRHEGIALAYAGIIAHDQADYAAAEQYSREALAIHTRIGDRRGSGNTLNNLALVLAEMGRRGEALALYEEALQTHRAVGHRLSEGTTLANMARLLGEAGEVGRARHLFRESLRIQKETANHANRGFTFFDLAVLERRAGTGPARLARLLDRAEAIADSAAARLLAVLCACERGHHALLQRQDTADLIAAVKESAAALGVDLREATEAGRALGRLQRAMRAVERGAPLLHGECPDTIPAGLRGQVGDPSAGGSP